MNEGFIHAAEPAAREAARRLTAARHLTHQELVAAVAERVACRPECARCYAAAAAAVAAVGEWDAEPMTHEQSVADAMDTIAGDGPAEKEREERAVQLATRPGGDLLPALFMLTDHGNVYAKYGTNRWQRIRLPWEDES